MGYRKLWLIIAALMVAAVMFSCQKGPEIDRTQQLSLSATSTTVDFDATATPLTVVAYADWTLSVASGANWITPSVTSGAANSTVKVNFALAPNSGEKSRKGIVSIKASGKSDPYMFSITQNAKNTLSGVNAWIHEQLSGWYYWNDVVKATPQVSNTFAYDEFLQATIESFPWSSVQDRSNGENPPTIDGQYQFDANGNLVSPLTRDHIYSYIDRFPAGTRAARGASDSYSTTFGFDIEPFRVGGTGTDPQLAFLLRWVQPDGPADKAGLKRGMWIYKYRGADIFWDQYAAFWNQLHFLEGGNTMSITDRSGKPYELTAAEIKVSPILHNEVLTTAGGAKVAYLIYNAFEMGDGGEFDDELRTVFGEFKSEGATELVLDLRYNPGGYVESCRILTSLAADVETSDVFIKMLRNKNITDVVRVENPMTEYFLKEPNGLKLSKIYVLATTNSASASEMVINSIRGALGENAVVHIGTRTNGKNVGMDLLDTEMDGFSYEMWPITFKVLNAKGFTDYAAGFVPTLYIDEFWDITHKDGSGELHDFGPDERMLKAALDVIDGKTVKPDTRGAVTRAAGSGKEQVRGFTDPRRGGAKYIPDLQK